MSLLTPKGCTSCCRPYTACATRKQGQPLRAMLAVIEEELTALELMPACTTTGS